MIVWLAAERVYPGRRFRDYALLGDDIAIADHKVAKEYLIGLSSLVPFNCAR